MGVVSGADGTIHKLIVNQQISQESVGQAHRCSQLAQKEEVNFGEVVRPGGYVKHSSRYAVYTHRQ